MATKKYLPEQIMPIVILSIGLVIKKLINLQFIAIAERSSAKFRPHYVNLADVEKNENIDPYIAAIVDLPKEEFDVLIKSCILRLAGCRTSLIKIYWSSTGISHPRELKDPRKVRRIADKIFNSLVISDPESSEEARLRICNYLRTIPYLILCLTRIVFHKKLDLKMSIRNRISREDLPDNFYNMGSYFRSSEVKLLTTLSKNVWEFSDSALELINNEPIKL